MFNQVSIGKIAIADLRRALKVQLIQHILDVSIDISFREIISAMGACFIL